MRYSGMPWVLRAVASTLLVAIFACSQASAQMVVDGDRIKFAGVTGRLFGIDAPESHQRCDNWPAGRMASLHLLELMKNRAVACKSLGIDRNGRTIGLCRADGEDLGRTMVRHGMAWAFFRSSRLGKNPRGLWAKMIRSIGVGWNDEDCRYARIG